MPEVILQLQWPDGRSSELYSPSTTILNHLQPGQTLSVAELQTRAMLGLEQASERVRARYGFACTHTNEEWRKLQTSAANYSPDQSVTITGQR